MIFYQYVIDLVLSYSSICPRCIFDSWKPTLSINSLGFSNIYLTLYLSVYFSEFYKCSFTVVIFFMFTLLKLLFLSMITMT